MKTEQRTVEVWEYLARCAANRQLTDLVEVERETGINSKFLPRCLGMIMSYCYDSKLPNLGSIIVDDGLSIYFDTAENSWYEVMYVHGCPWQNIETPESIHFTPYLKMKP